MTTNTMTCALFSDRLMAYLEREIDEPTRAALERHALTCTECGALLADLRTLRIDASNLPEIAPSRDLWSGIAARIETPVLPITGEWTTAQRRAPARRWVRGAAMAASLVAAAALGYLGANTRRGTQVVVTTAQKPETLTRSVAQAPETLVVAARPTTAIAQPAAQRSAPATVASSPTPVRNASAVQAYTTVVSDYDREIAKLRALIDRRRNQMDPVTVAVIEKNLQVIDVAIAECKKAIARDPSSRFLIESLNQSLQAKVELMRTAALLPSRS